MISFNPQSCNQKDKITNWSYLKIDLIKIYITNIFNIQYITTEQLAAWLSYPFVHICYIEGMNQD